MHGRNQSEEKAASSSQPPRRHAHCSTACKLAVTTENTNAPKRVVELLGAHNWEASGKHAKAEVPYDGKLGKLGRSVAMMVA